MTGTELKKAKLGAGIPLPYHDDPKGRLKEIPGVAAQLDRWNSKAHLVVCGAKGAQDVIYLVMSRLVERGEPVRVAGLQTLRELYFGDRQKLNDNVAPCDVLAVLAFQEDVGQFPVPFDPEHVPVMDWYFQRLIAAGKRLVVQVDPWGDAGWWSSSLSEAIRSNCTTIRQ